MAQASRKNFEYRSGPLSTAKHTSGATITSGDLCVLTSGVVELAADTNTSINFLVAAEDVADGAVGLFYAMLPGSVWRCKAASAVDFAMGAEVYVASSGGATVDAGTQNDRSVGIVCNQDPASAGYVDVFVPQWASATHA